MMHRVSSDILEVRRRALSQPLRLLEQQSMIPLHLHSNVSSKFPSIVAVSVTNEHNYKGLFILYHVHDIAEKPLYKFSGFREPPRKQ